jgi:hypothetical protein
VNCLRSEGIPESWEGASTGEWSAPPEEIEAFLKQRSFLASDRAAATTGTVINLTSGTVVD